MQGLGLRTFPGLIETSVAEVMCVREAFGWLHCRQQPGVNQIESNALLVIQALQDSADEISPLGLVATDCKALLRLYPHSSVAHVPRSANRVAHYIVQTSVSHPNVGE